MIEVKDKHELLDVIQNNDKVVVKWGAEWCAPCKMLEKTLFTIDDVTVVKIDVEECDQCLVEEYSIMNVPVLVYFIKGEEVKRTVGNISKEKILEVFN